MAATTGVLDWIALYLPSWNMQAFLLMCNTFIKEISLNHLFLPRKIFIDVSSMPFAKEDQIHKMIIQAFVLFASFAKADQLPRLQSFTCCLVDKQKLWRRKKKTPTTTTHFSACFKNALLLLRLCLPIMYEVGYVMQLLLIAAALDSQLGPRQPAEETMHTAAVTVNSH